MTAHDFISKLPAMDFDRLSWIFAALAHKVPDARLSNGGRLNDGTDFAAWLLELAQAARSADQRKLMGFVASDPCPRCGHVHQGSSECGEPMGGDRICHCELEVRA